MSLVPGLLQNAKRRRASGEAQRLRSPHGEDLFLALRQTDKRQSLEPQCLECRMGRVELTLATIDDDQIRKRLPFVEPASKVARDDLVHRREVVDPLHV